MPRGSSSSSAISPGVYSSKWRSTITAALLGRQRAERGDERLEPGGARARRPPSRASSTSRAQRPRARPVDRAVHHDPVQPRPERPAAVEAVERAHRGEERLLRDVLGAGRVVHHEVRRPVGARPVVAVERLQRRRRPGLRRAHGGALLAVRRHARIDTRSPRSREAQASRAVRPGAGHDDRGGHEPSTPTAAGSQGNESPSPRRGRLADGEGARVHREQGPAAVEHTNGTPAGSRRSRMEDASCPASSSRSMQRAVRFAVSSACTNGVSAGAVVERVGPAPAGAVARLTGVPPIFSSGSLGSTTGSSAAARARRRRRGRGSGRVERREVLDQVDERRRAARPRRS